MADSAGSLNRGCRQHLLQINQAPDLFTRLNFPTAEYRNSSRVISPIFQPLQSVNQDRGRFFSANITNYSAHNASFPLKQILKDGSLPDNPPENKTKNPPLGPAPICRILE
jgi:hypothetical protein